MKADHEYSTTYDVIGDYYYTGEHLLFGNRIPPSEKQFLERPFQAISFKFERGVDETKKNEINEDSIESILERRKNRPPPDFDKWEPNLKQKINKDLYYPLPKPYEPKDHLKNSRPVYIVEPETIPLTTYQRSYENFLVPYYKHKRYYNLRYPFYNDYIMNPKRPNYHEVCKSSKY